jgi:hypothetical protein
MAVLLTLEASQLEVKRSVLGSGEFAFGFAGCSAIAVVLITRAPFTCGRLSLSRR